MLNAGGVRQAAHSGQGASAGGRGGFRVHTSSRTTEQVLGMWARLRRVAPLKPETICTCVLSLSVVLRLTADVLDMNISRNDSLKKSLA